MFGRLLLYNKSAKGASVAVKPPLSVKELQAKEDEMKMESYHKERLAKFYSDAVTEYGKILKVRSPNPMYKVGDTVLLNVYESNSWRGGPRLYLEYNQIPFDTLYTILDVSFDIGWMFEHDHIHHNVWYETIQPCYERIKNQPDEDAYDAIRTHIFSYFRNRKTDAVGWVYSVEPVTKTHDGRPWCDASEEVLIYADGIRGSKYKRLLKLITLKENMKSKLKEIESSISNLEHDEAIRTRR